jgi:hypothetical protein
VLNLELHSYPQRVKIHEYSATARTAMNRSCKEEKGRFPRPAKEVVFLEEQP